MFTHYVFVDGIGSVYGLGTNNDGELGLGYGLLSTIEIVQITELPPTREVSCGEGFSICVTLTNEVYSFGNNKLGQLGVERDGEKEYLPIKVPSLKDIDFVECGYTFIKYLFYVLDGQKIL